MGKYDKEMQHWREKLRVAEADLEALVAGQMKMGEDRGEGWVDTTEKWTERLKAEVAGLEHLIMAYEVLEASERGQPSDELASKREIFPEMP